MSHAQHCGREHYVILDAPLSAISGTIGTLAAVTWGTRLDYAARYAALGAAHQIFTGASDLPGIANAPFVALSLHPSSTLRSALIYFDRSSPPVPLVGGQIIRRRFERVRADTLRETTRLLPYIGNLETNGIVAPQRLRLCAWLIDPEFDRLELASAVSVACNPSTLTGATTVPALYLVHPGAHRVRYWAGNNNTLNPNAVGGTVYRMHSQRGETQSAPLYTAATVHRENVAAGTFTIPAAADGFQVDPLEIGTPGPESWITALPAGAGNHTVSIGAEIVFENDW